MTTQDSKNIEQKKSSEHKHDDYTCCSDHEKDEEMSEDKKSDSIIKKIRTQPMQALVIILGIMVILNVLVMGWFTISVNGKLSDAIEQTTPQRGLLTLILPSDCKGCGEFEVEKQKFETQNILFTDEYRLDASSEDAKKLIEKEGITQLPAMIFTAEKSIRDTVFRVAEETGSRMSEDMMTLVWEKKQTPYVNIADGKITGLVSVTYVTDKSCKDCYDVVNVQRTILTRFGIAIGRETILDVSDANAKTLLKTYGITAVPTILLSPEAQMYGSLMEVWPQVGSVEQDGIYVFRELEAIGGTYKDLEIGKVIKKEQTS